jgi:hypothetical protein
MEPQDSQNPAIEHYSKTAESILQHKDRFHDNFYLINVTGKAKDVPVLS